MTNKSHAEGLLKDCISAGLLTDNHEINLNLNGLIRRDIHSGRYTLIYYANTFNEVSGFLAGILFAHRQVKNIPS